jgi:hypothetical protein
MYIIESSTASNSTIRLIESISCDELIGLLFVDILLIAQSIYLSPFSKIIKIRMLRKRRKEHKECDCSPQVPRMSQPP